MALLSLEKIAQIRGAAHLYAERERARRLRAETRAREQTIATRRTVLEALRRRNSLPLSHLLDIVPQPHVATAVRIAAMERSGDVTTSSVIDGTHDAATCIVTWTGRSAPGQNQETMR